MYSYKERIKAVELYIELGRRASVAVRMLGYPSKKYLRQWVLIYDETGDLPKNVNRKPMFTSAQKQIMIDHYLNNGQCFTGLPPLFLANSRLIWYLMLNLPVLSVS